MSEKLLNGKAIYSPKGKAGEYAKYAVNFYVGCSNDCDYCYCKRGVLAHAMGQPKATLKKCFKDYMHATDVFRKELSANIEEFRKHGLFFTFTSDPCLDETWFLTWTSVDWAVMHGVPCKILTKRADFMEKHRFPPQWERDEYKNLIAWGFTLTGHDEMERGASTNAERIETMKKLHEMGFKTFASIEPIVDIKSSVDMIWNTRGFCDLYKIGLMSGKRNYTREDVRRFFIDTLKCIETFNKEHNTNIKIYWKDSVREYIQLVSCNFPCCVDADYNMFKTESL